MSLKKILLQHSIDLSRHTTIKIGGKARNFFTVNTPEDLGDIVADYGESLYILGRGSNLLVRDVEIETPVVKLAGQFSDIKQSGDDLVVGAATPFSFLLKYCLNNNLGGLERLAGIPASFGGLLCMNASSYGFKVSSCLKEIEVMDMRGNVKVLDRDKIKFGYRFSSLQEFIVLRASLHLEKTKDVRKNINYFLRKRLTSQDFHFPSCGCVFKNASLTSAGSLIDSCNLKGFAMGGAQISHRHANFIINRGWAVYSDVDYIIKIIQDKVYKKHGILLQEEIKRWT